MLKHVMYKAALPKWEMWRSNTRHIGGTVLEQMCVKLTSSCVLNTAHTLSKFGPESLKVQSEMGIGTFPRVGC